MKAVCSMKENTSSRLQFALSTVILGTIGMVSRALPLPSTFVTLVRGIIGSLFLLAVLGLKKEKLDFGAIRKNLIPLAVSGMLLAVTMCLLYESYAYLTVGTATMFFNTAPIIVVAISPLLFKEKMTGHKLACVGVACVGVVCISGIIENGLPKTLSEATGILIAMSGAFTYAAVMVVNKKIRDIPAFDKTIVQLLSFPLILVPYNLITGSFSGFTITPRFGFLLLVMGTVYGGLSYLLYFGNLDKIPSATAALLCYLEPVTAILVSALILQEPVTAVNLLGAALILGSAAVSELPLRPRRQAASSKAESMEGLI